MKKNSLRGLISLLFSISMTPVLSFGITDSGDTATFNIVLILADDMGYGDLASYGATGYQTPHLDRLAREGMRFTHFYVGQPVCSASRAGLLTGCYPNRVGITGALNPAAATGLNPGETTIAELLKTRGYHTAAVGKWHLGHHLPFLPLQQGFDEYLGLPYSNDMTPFFYDGTRNIPAAYERKKSFPELPLIQGNSRIRELKNLEDQEELTTLYTDKAVDFIKRNSDHPFFLYLAHSMPHVPLAVSSGFRGKSEQGIYGDVMMELDWSVGKIVETLEKEGVADRTLIIFTSDNGPWMSFGDHAGSSGGLREGKATVFEGGQRVPCIMRWPDVIPAGTICEQLASTIDILPTLAAVSGAALPGHKIDGVNIFPLLRGEPAANPRQAFYYYWHDELDAVREGKWKLVLPHRHRSYDGAVGRNGLPGENKQGETGLALYDLRRDPGERYDVSESNPEVVSRLMELVRRARLDLGDSRTGDKGNGKRPAGKIEK